MQVLEQDRSWSVGLSQLEFEREYLSRFPYSDVVPDVEIWSVGHEQTYPELIDGVFASDVLADDSEAQAKEKRAQVEAEPPKSKDEIAQTRRERLKGNFPCRGCGQVFEYKVARAGHEKRCKVALQTKITEE